MMIVKIKIILLVVVFLPTVCIAQLLFEDDFEGNLSGWEINNVTSVEIIDSQDSKQGKVLTLKPNGNVSALIKDSDQWGSVKVEGQLLFPKNEHNYLGFIYNYKKTTKREDFGLLYVKGNGSYIRANPWRDGNVSRLLYEEYKTNLEGDQAIKIGQWHTFKMEVINETCHLYINDMKRPKITFGLFELKSGKIGFQPRVTGGDVWIDNIKVTSIEQFNYKGENIPPLTYEPDSLLTKWEVFGPVTKPNLAIEQVVGYDDTPIDTNKEGPTWENFKTDARGALITGRITEYEGENTVAYFRTSLVAKKDKTATLHFTTTDELTLYLNGKDVGRVYRDGYISKDNDWNAWYDFWKNPQHKGRKKKISLKKGKNQLVIKVRNGQFASGGFFAYMEK
ncbi:DUF1080 domain-containing protein [Flagellimonas sp. HMM57]|uniref:hypothetical protein n=1 Tax=unclassified Flagellimonas TaxID=2644544 RepID=UPI0013D33AB5|nr:MULTISPECIES: hypothetical protein [unclassified Flagellimonas]UII75155.1 DUF1080 domain-containing protein [Flagellimonas sp. HMM57]